MSDNPLANLFAPDESGQPVTTYRVKGPHISRVLFPDAPSSSLVDSPAVPQPTTVQQPRRSERLVRRASCPSMAMTAINDENTTATSEDEAQATLPRRLAEISLGDLESYDPPQNTIFHSYPSGLPVPTPGYHGYTAIAEPGMVSDVIDNMDYGTIDTPTHPPKKRIVRFAAEPYEHGHNRKMNEISCMPPASERLQAQRDLTSGYGFTAGNMTEYLWGNTADDPWANVVEDPYMDAHWNWTYVDDANNGSQRTEPDKELKSPQAESLDVESHESVASASVHPDNVSPTVSASKGPDNNKEKGDTEENANGKTDDADTTQPANFSQAPKEFVPVPSLKRTVTAKKARMAKELDAVENNPIDKYPRIGSSKADCLAMDMIAGYNKEYTDARSAALNLRVHLATTNNTSGNAANPAEASRASGSIPQGHAPRRAVPGRPQAQPASGYTSAISAPAAPLSPAGPGYSPSAAGTMANGPPIFGARHPGLIPASATGNPSSPGDPFVDAGTTPGRGRMGPSPLAGRGSAKRSHDQMSGTTSMAARDAARERELLGRAPGFVISGPARSPFQGNAAGGQRRQQGLSDSPYGVRKMAKRDGQEDEEMDMDE